MTESVEKTAANGGLENFESDMKRLKELVKTMEEGNTDLAKAMKQYEEGAKLVSRLREVLETTEQQLNTLEGKDDSVPF